MYYVPFELVFLIVLVLCFPLAFWWTVRRKCAGSMYCGVISKGKPIQFKLLKIREGEFLEDGEDHWIIQDKQVKLTQYPAGWMWEMFPMSLFQQTVPTSLYMRGRGDPLDWEEPSSGSISSKELKAILDPNWMKSLVQGVVEGGGGASKRDRMLLFLAVGLGAISLILIFVLLTKLGALEQAIKVVR